MQDIPLFTCRWGVATLLLTQLPARGCAYIIPRTFQNEKALVSECAAFCRGLGASQVFAQCTQDLFPLHSCVLRMVGTADPGDDTGLRLFPVTEKTVSHWRDVVNERMRGTDHARFLAWQDEKRILETRGAYFIHHDGELWGVGWLADGKLLALASLHKGNGERVLRTLFDLCRDERIELEVASTNTAAIRLYERLGFLAVEEKARWCLVKESY